MTGNCRQYIMGEEGPVVKVVGEGLMDENRFELVFVGRITFMQVNKKGGMWLRRESC